MLPAPRFSGGIEPRLIDLAERWMLSRARETGYELQLVGATVVPQRRVIARTVERSVWAEVFSAGDEGLENDRTPNLVLVGGSNVERMVELAGLQPGDLLGAISIAAPLRSGAVLRIL